MCSLGLTGKEREFGDVGTGVVGVAKFEQTGRARKEIESKSSIFFNSAHSFVIPIACTLRRFFIVISTRITPPKARLGFFTSNTLPNYHLKETSSVFT